MTQVKEACVIVYFYIIYDVKVINYMSDKLKLFLQENRQLVIEEDFSALLQKCPVELRTELRELYGEVEAEFDRKLDPEMYVAWWYAGDKTSISAHDLNVTKLKDAPVTEDTPYLLIVTEYKKIPDIQHVVKFEGDYYILDDDIKSRIDAARTKKLAKERKARNVATGRDVFNREFNAARKELHGYRDESCAIRYDRKIDGIHMFYAYPSSVQYATPLKIGVEYNEDDKKTKIGTVYRWFRDYYKFDNGVAEVTTTSAEITNTILNLAKRYIGKRSIQNS